MFFDNVTHYNRDDNRYVKIPAAKSLHFQGWFFLPNHGAIQQIGSSFLEGFTKKAGTVLRTKWVNGYTGQPFTKYGSLFLKAKKLPFNIWVLECLNLQIWPVSNSREFRFELPRHSSWLSLQQRHHMCTVLSAAQSLDEVKIKDCRGSRERRASDEPTETWKCPFPKTWTRFIWFHIPKINGSGICHQASGVCRDC